MIKDYRVVITGAIPPRSVWGAGVDNFDWMILRFVSMISSLILKNGGGIIHSGHPTFSPILRHRARRFLPECDERFVLFVSEHEVIDWDADLRKRRLRESTVFVTRRAQNREQSIARKLSLATMRRNMIASANAVVAIGLGERQFEAETSGVAEEVGFAMNAGIPVFRVGDATVRTDESGLSSELGANSFRRTGLDPATLVSMRTSRDLTFIGSTILSALGARKAQPIRGADLSEVTPAAEYFRSGDSAFLRAAAARATTERRRAARVDRAVDDMLKRDVLDPLPNRALAFLRQPFDVDSILSLYDSFPDFYRPFPANDLEFLFLIFAQDLKSSLREATSDYLRSLRWVERHELITPRDGWAMVGICLTLRVLEFLQNHYNVSARHQEEATRLLEYFLYEPPTAAE